MKQPHRTTPDRTTTTFSEVNNGLYFNALIVYTFLRLQYRSYPPPETYAI
jgi:hypothetical protein